MSSQRSTTHQQGASSRYRWDWMPVLQRALVFSRHRKTDEAYTTSASVQRVRDMPSLLPGLAQATLGALRLLPHRSTSTSANFCQDCQDWRRIYPGAIPTDVAHPLTRRAIELRRDMEDDLKVALADVMEGSDDCRIPKALLLRIHKHWHTVLEISPGRTIPGTISPRFSTPFDTPMSTQRKRSRPSAPCSSRSGRANKQTSTSTQFQPSQRTSPAKRNHGSPPYPRPMSQVGR